MITPSFGLTATERVLPNFAVDFTTAILNPRITFTRVGNTATYINSSGIITAINANLPRFDYNPTTLVCKGLLIEETRKNLFLNSLIDGTNLSTQTVTTTATATTISFYGTGSVVLSGTHSATVNGLGAYPTRTTYTFTPTAGALTATVSGTVQYAQIEAGAFATSFIPTDATVGGITRNADVATMTGTNFSDWYNASEGTFAVQSDFPKTQSSRVLDVWSTVDTKHYIAIFRNGGNLSYEVYDNTSQSVLSVAGTSNFKSCFSYKTNAIGFSVNKSNTQTDLLASIPTPNMMYIGMYGGGGLQINGTIQKISYWSQRLTNNEIQANS